MKHKYIVRLSIEERGVIFQLLKEGRASKEKKNRARILLKSGLWTRRGKLERATNRRSLVSEC